MVGRGNDLDDITVVQLRFQGHQAAVDPCANAGMANIAVYGVGKIDRCCSLGKLFDFPARRKDKNLFREQVDLDRVHKLAGIRKLTLPFHQLAQPAEPASLLIIPRSCFPFLVFPVCSDPLLGHIMHIPGADLDFHAIAEGADDGSMQRLVHVGLGHGDVVFEASRNRLPGGVDDAQHFVALAHGIDNHPEGDQVMNLLKVDSLPLHLEIDGIKMLEATGNLALDPLLFKFGGDQFFNLSDIAFPLFLLATDLFGEFLVGLGFKVAKTEVFQFTFEPADTESVGKRRINIESFPGDAFLLFNRLVRQGPHIVDPVSQLDQNNADIPCHGDKHLAEVFCLAFLVGTQKKLADFGHAVDQ